MTDKQLNRSAAHRSDHQESTTSLTNRNRPVSNKGGINIGHEDLRADDTSVITHTEPETLTPQPTTHSPQPPEELQEWGSRTKRTAGMPASSWSIRAITPYTAARRSAVITSAGVPAAPTRPPPQV